MDFNYYRFGYEFISISIGLVAQMLITSRIYATKLRTYTKNETPGFSIELKEII